MVRGGVGMNEALESKLEIGAAPSLYRALHIPDGSEGFVQLMEKDGVFDQGLGFEPLAVRFDGDPGGVASILTVQVDDHPDQTEPLPALTCQ